MPNLIYGQHETGSTVKWGDSAQTPDETLTFASLSSGAVRYGDRHFFGSTGRATRYNWRGVIRMATAGVIGETVDLYLSFSDGTRPDGEIGTTDAAGSTDKLNNLTYIGSIVIDTTSTNTNITAGGTCYIFARYASLVVHNNTADGLHSSDSTQWVEFIPIPDEIQ